MTTIIIKSTRVNPLTHDVRGLPIMNGGIPS